MSFRPLARVSSWRRLSTAMWDEHVSPQVLGFDDVDMTELNALIASLREGGGEHVTVTHFVIKAIGTVMARHPDLNVLLVRGRPMQRTTVDVFVQVAIPKTEGHGAADLSGVQVRDVDQKSVFDIARELRERAERVRVGDDQQMERAKRSMDRVPRPLLRWMVRFLSGLSFDRGLDLSRIGVKPDAFGCAMVTNCAGFGVNAGFAPLVPAARTPVILLLGRTEPRPVVRDGQIVARPIMRFCGTFDHRLLDGYQIGVISRELCSLLESPAQLLPDAQRS